MKSYQPVRSSLVFAFAALAAALHGQTAAPMTAAPEAPAPEMAKAPSTWLLGISYDVFRDDVQWGGFGSVRNFYTTTTGTSDFGSGGKTIRSPKLDGVTVSAGKGVWAFDFSYRTGHSSLAFPITYTANQAGDTLTVKFADRVSWQDKVYDVRLRNTFLKLKGWAGYWSVGYFSQTTDQKYRQTVTLVSTRLAGDLTRNFNTGTSTLAGLSGNVGQQYASVGLGLAKVFSLNKDWVFALKGEGAFLGGNVKAQQASGSFDPSALGAVTGSNSSSTVYGGKGSGSARLQFAATDSLSLALEGGAEYWRFFSGSGNSSKFTSGYFGRAVAQIRF